MTSNSPVQLDLDSPLEVQRWRVIGNPIMAIPLGIYMYVLTLVFGVVTFIAWWAILFTGAYPEQMFNFSAGIMRFQWRTYTFAYFLREPYPSFTLVSSPTDPGDDPAKLSVDYPQKLSRVLLFFRIFLLIPVFLVLFVYGIGAYVMLIVGFFTVLFTGKWSEGARNYLVRVWRYGFRTLAYYYLLTDVYPGFSLQ